MTSSTRSAALTRTAWEYVADTSRVRRLETSTDPCPVYGPFDLCFNAGDVLDLRLHLGELALITCRGEVRAVLMDGHHALRVEEAGGEGAAADCLVHFLNLHKVQTIEWAQELPVPGSPDGRATRAAHGRFGVRIVAPLRFHAALLRDRSATGEAVCRDALAQLVPSLLAIRLASARTADGDGTPELIPACLDAELAEYGLECVSLEFAFD